jgi:hypothetical protein
MGDRMADAEQGRGQREPLLVEAPVELAREVAGVLVLD